MKVSIVIPNYNTWELVQRNVDACLEVDKPYIHEIIVVDDCSPSRNFIKFDDKVRVIRNEINLQYTATVNVGLKAADGDIIVLLDSDAYPLAPFLDNLINIYVSDPSIGCVGFKTVDGYGNDTGNILPEPSILSLISGQKIHKVLRKFNPFESKRVLPFSCAVSFRETMLNDIGYLDESFPVLEADHDMSMRIYRSDRWNLLYEPSICIYHTGGGSISLNSKRVLSFYKYRWQLLDKYNKIQFPSLIRSIIIFRFLIELGILQLQLFYTNRNKEAVKDKIEGRGKLIRSFSKV